MLTISLTSIPPRFHGIGPTLESLVAQSAADTVRLTLPRRYRRFAGQFDLPVLPQGVVVHRCETDLGPATKWAPAIEEVTGRVLICDDDWLYGPGWAQGFLDAAVRHPGAAIAASSFDAARLGVGGGSIVQGFAGVLLERGMLPVHLPQMPDGVREVDDVWLSGLLAMAGTSVVTVPELRDLCVPSGNEASALQTQTDRANLNTRCAKLLRSRFGIW